MSDNATTKNKITPNDYIRITGKSYFVGNEETRKYHGDWLLRRDYIHTKEVAKICAKHPNVIAIHCMISESNIPFWCDNRLGAHQFDSVLKYRLDNPSVVPGIYQYMRVEFRNLYFSPWYYAGVQYVEPGYEQFKINYTVNSLGDECIRALHSEAIEEMLNFFDGSALFARKMKQWNNIVKTRQDLLLNAARVRI